MKKGSSSFEIAVKVEDVDKTVRRQSKLAKQRWFTLIVPSSFVGRNQCSLTNNKVELCCRMNRKIYSYNSMCTPQRSSYILSLT